MKRFKKTAFCILASIMLIVTAFPGFGPVSVTAADSSVTVDYSQRMDPPLLKKISMYNAGIIQPYKQRYDISLPTISALGANTLRNDLSIGKDGCWLPNLVSGTYPNFKYDFAPLDYYVRALNDVNVLPAMSWCYIPKPLQGPNGLKWTDLNDDILNWREQWQEIHKQYAKHYRDLGLRIGYHEIYNEPDLELLRLWGNPNFRGFLEISDFQNYYNDMYKYGVWGIKEGDPDAVVGGPAFAIGELLDNPVSGRFLSFVNANDLPLDFFSFHSYMEEGTWPKRLNEVRRKLADYPRYLTTDVFINEFSWLNGKNGAGDGFNSISRYYQAAVPTLNAVVEINRCTDVAEVNWAQFMATGATDTYGIVSVENYVKASYNALKIYADMPVERVKTLSLNSSISVLASGDGSKQSCLLWNNSDDTQTISVDLNNLPFSDGQFTLYRIDAENASFFDTRDPEKEHLSAVEQYMITGSDYTKENLSIPAKGVVYIVIDDKSDVPVFTPDAYNNFVADDLKVTRYYADRFADSFASFSRKTWKTYQGMGGSEFAIPFTSVTAQNLPPVLNVQYKLDGEYKTRDKNAVLGLRVDYMVDGEYTHSVMYHGGLYNPQRDFKLPWGMETAVANETYQVNLANFDVPILDNAPKGWSGRAIISFLMQNCGAGTRADITILDAADNPNPGPRIKGDVNGDGKITVTDALMTLQASAGKRTLTQAEHDAADVNEDGVITVTDALIILQVSVGKRKF